MDVSMEHDRALLEYNPEFDRLYSFVGEYGTDKITSKKNQKLNDKKTIFWMHVLDKMSVTPSACYYEVHNFMVTENGQSNQFIQANLTEMIKEIFFRFVVWRFDTTTQQLTRIPNDVEGTHVALLLNPSTIVTTDIVLRFIDAFLKQGITFGIIVINQDHIYMGNAPIPIGITNYTFGGTKPVVASAASSKKFTIPVITKTKEATVATAATTVTKKRKKISLLLILLPKNPNYCLYH